MKKTEFTDLDGSTWRIVADARIFEEIKNEFPSMSDREIFQKLFEESKDDLLAYQKKDDSKYDSFELKTSYRDYDLSLTRIPNKKQKDSLEEFKRSGEILSDEAPKQTLYSEEFPY